MALVVVSNRIARPQPDVPIEGGLAAALLPAVEASGAIWVGASGRLVNTSEKSALAEIEALGSGAVAGIHLPRAHYAGYYQGYSNSALWPVLHSRPDLLQASGSDYASYRAINSYMARSLLRFAAAEMFWIHDYHFLPLAAELRDRGVAAPIGFFLHTPFPEPEIFAKLPQHRELAQAMLAYDLIGFQTEDDTQRFAAYLNRELGLACSSDGVVTPAARPTRLASFPIGIDAERFARRAIVAAAAPDVARLRSSLQGGLLAIGVDRIDYSKGLPSRLKAFDRLLTRRPDLRRAVSLLQIAVPSRQQLRCYSRLQAEIAALVGEINGRHGEIDWVPIRYVTRGYSQAKLAGFYRAARVGLVTPHRDGMNLVAKEYVAAQNPHDPGMLVLSRFAGAAKQLDAALLIDPDDAAGLARTLANAFAMPLEERRDRWQTMMAELCRSSLDGWFSDFTSALAAVAAPAVEEEEEVDLVPALPSAPARSMLQVS